MSPEQARGESVDHRSDLFSLGCVLYAMCVGRSPFRAETPTGAIHRVCEDTPRPIRELNPDIPEWLVAIIDRLLEKKAEDRFQSATEVAVVLGQYLAHVQQPSKVSRPAAQRKFPAMQRPWRIGPWSAASGLLMVILLAVVASQWFGKPDASRPGWTKTTELGPPPPPPERFTFVDLTKHANLLLTQPPAPDAREGTLAELERHVEPLGRVLSVDVLTVGQIPVRVPPSYIQLQGERVPGFPEKVTGISVNCLAGKVHFLHGCAWVQDGSRKPVATYTFHYDDGTSEAMSIIQGRHLRDWWSRSSLPEEATRATRAWTGSNPLVAKNQLTLQLFLCSWVNPHPEKMITSIDFERGPLKSPAPFRLGVTCDQDATVLPEEPGLVIVDIGQFAGAGRYSVVVGNSAGRPLRGNGKHSVLVPAGRQPLEIRDGAIVVRRGSIEVTPGGIAFVIIDAQSTFLALPKPQPDPRKELTGQLWGIFDCAVSHDGRMLATAAGDGTVILWRLEQGIWSRHATLEAGSSIVRSVAFSPTSPLLASAGHDGALKLWDRASTGLVATLKENEQNVSALAFSPDGNTLVSGNGDGTIELWNVATREKLGAFAAHTGMIAKLAFSPDGSALVTSSWGDNIAKVWDLPSRQLKRAISGHTDKIGSVVFSPDGRTIASASSDTTVKLWDAETGQLLASFPNPDRMYAVAFSPDGRQLAAGGFFQTVRIWDLASHKVVHDFLAHWAEVRSLVFTPDGETLVTSAWDNSTRVWSVSGLPDAFDRESEGPRPSATFKAWEDWTMWAAFAPKAAGDRLAAVPVLGGCRVWDLKDWTATGLQVYKNDPGTLAGWMCEDSLHFTPNGKEVVTCVTTNTWPSSLAISPDDKTLAVGTNLGRVLLLDAKTGKDSHPPLQHGTALVTAVKFSPDATILVSAGKDTVVKVWDLSSYNSQTLPTAHHEKITSAAFSPDGKVLVTTGGAWMMDKDILKRQGEVCLWDVAAWKLLTKFTAHYGSVSSAVFSPAGKRLATTGRDGKMHLWDVEELLKWQEKKEAN